MSIYHKHHIIPKHMGGTDDPSNLVELTIEEHAEAHRKLFEQYGHWQDELAWKGLAKMIGKTELISEVIRKTHKGNKYFLGRKHKESTKHKMSSWQLGRKLSDAHRNKMSESAKKRGPLKNSQFGTMWIHNPELLINKKIKKDTPIPIGWVKGRKLVVTVALEATHSSL
jgi:NUMOD3 motif